MTEPSGMWLTHDEIVLLADALDALALTGVTPVVSDLEALLRLADKIEKAAR